MRALVISDSHFGAWTGEDLLRHDHELALLAPHLDVGDLFDFLFASVGEAVDAADGFLSLLRDPCRASAWSSWPATTTTI